MAITEGSQGRNSGRSLEAGTEGECSYLLAPRLTLSELSYTTQVHMPRDGAAPAGLGPPMSVSNKGKTPLQTCP